MGATWIKYLRPINFSSIFYVCMTAYQNIIIISKKACFFYIFICSMVYSEYFILYSKLSEVSHKISSYCVKTFNKTKFFPIIISKYTNKLDIFIKIFKFKYNTWKYIISCMNYIVYTILIKNFYCLFHIAYIIMGI